MKNMIFVRHKYRELIFQMLFSFHFGICEEKQLILLMMKQLRITKKMAHEAYIYCKKIFSQKKILDEKISIVSKEYAINRIAKVEYTTLHLALYEIFFDRQIPYRVCIAEALRLAKKFATKQSASFVNAILDAIYKNEGENFENISKKKT